MPVKKVARINEQYIPDLDIKYPENPDDHIVDIKAVHDVNVDEKYPFLDKTFSFKIKRFLGYLVIFTLVPIVGFIRFGFKIEGRNILRKHKKLLKDGAMTVSNHVQRWDFMFVQAAVRCHFSYFPVWKEQLKSTDAGAIRVAGGIPIPEGIHAIKNFNKAFDEIHAKKKWIHAFPESSRFDYFPSIRPFKKGVFTMAFRYSLPVLPLAISWRKPRFPYGFDNLLRLLSGNKKLLPMITIRIGEPLQFDADLDRKQAVLKMRKDCHEEIVRLAGIKANPYTPEGD